MSLDRRTIGYLLAFGSAAAGAVRYNLAQAYAHLGRDAEAAAEMAEHDRTLAAALAQEQEARRRDRTLHSIVLQEERLARAAGNPAEEYSDLARLYTAAQEALSNHRPEALGLFD